MEKIKPITLSGHAHADLPDDIVLQMDEAWQAWLDSKDSKLLPQNLNDILDKYLAYAKLMRKHVDPYWS